MKRINEKLMKIFEKKSQRKQRRRRSESHIGSPSLDSDILSKIDSIITSEKMKFKKNQEDLIKVKDLKKKLSETFEKNSKMESIEHKHIDIRIQGINLGETITSEIETPKHH